MRNNLKILLIPEIKCTKTIIILTFPIENRIFKTNAKTFCFETDHMVEWKRSGINHIYYYKTKKVYCGLIWSPYACSSGPNFGVFPEGKQRREECLKSKMAEKYDLNITMIVCRIGRWRKYIRFWFLLKCFHHLQLKQIWIVVIGIMIAKTKILRMEVV